MEERFCVLVLEMRKSPYDAMMCLREEMPDKTIPCLKSWYNLIYSGQSKVKYGMEFYNASKIEHLLKVKVYYTRAYAAWGKGSIENCNRLVRRWYPKSTNFRKVRRSDIRQLEYAINTIHRKALNGATAYAYETLAA